MQPEPTPSAGNAGSETPATEPSVPSKSSEDGNGTAKRTFDLDELVHELRGPLAAALIASEDIDVESRTTKTLHASLQHLRSLLTGMTLAESGPTAVAAAIADAVLIADPHGRVLVTCAVPELASVCCAPTRFRQLLVNLIGNALKFSPEDTRVEVIANVEGSKVIIDVVDHGGGISESDAALMFERGVRGSGHDHVSGTGLGLAIARRLARDCGGETELLHTGVEGSVFRVTLNLL